MIEVDGEAEQIQMQWSKHEIHEAARRLRRRLYDARGGAGAVQRHRRGDGLVRDVDDFAAGLDGRSVQTPYRARPFSSFGNHAASMPIAGRNAQT